MSIHKLIAVAMMVITMMEISGKTHPMEAIYEYRSTQKLAIKTGKMTTITLLTMAIQSMHTSKKCNFNIGALYLLFPIIFYCEIKTVH